MRFATVGACCAALCAGLAAAPAMAECQFVKIGDMTVDTSHGVPLVEIEVGGQKKFLIINTGAPATTLTDAGAASLGIRGVENPNSRIFSSKGEEHYTVAALKDLTMGGQFHLHNLDVLVGGGEPVTNDVVGYLGQDIMGASDIEFDLAHDRISFFSEKGCGTTPLAYWGGAFSMANIRRPTPEEPHVIITIKLNGKPQTAQISSTSGISQLDFAAAGAAGVTPTTPGVETLPLQGLNDKSRWIGKFDSFAIGEEEIKNVRIVFSDLWSQGKGATTGSHVQQTIVDFPAMLLGLDFLRAHRVLFANTQGKMYFSYNGGPVFRTPTAAQ